MINRMQWVMQWGVAMVTMGGMCQSAQSDNQMLFTFSADFARDAEAGKHVVGEEVAIISGREVPGPTLPPPLPPKAKGACYNSTTKLCCTCVSFLDSGDMLLLRELTRDAKDNVSCKTLYNAYVDAFNYTDMKIAVWAFNTCTGHFKNNITAFDDWVNEGPDFEPVASCETLKFCEKLPNNASGDVSIQDLYADKDEDKKGDDVAILGAQVDIVVVYNSTKGCNSGKMVLTLSHESGATAVWGATPLDYSGAAFPLREAGWVVDTGHVPAATNLSKWFPCNEYDAVALCWPSGKYTATLAIYNGDVSGENMYAESAVSFMLEETYERPGAFAGNASPTPCYGTEKPISLRQLKGAFCSPACSGSLPCPGLPASMLRQTSAEPKCVLERQGNKSPTNCALLCKAPSSGVDPNPSRTNCTLPGGCLCPAGAACHAVSGAPGVYTGMCSYY